MVQGYLVLNKTQIWQKLNYLPSTTQNGKALPKEGVKEKTKPSIRFQNSTIRYIRLKSKEPWSSSVTAVKMYKLCLQIVVKLSVEPTSQSIVLGG